MEAQRRQPRPAQRPAQDVAQQDVGINRAALAQSVQLAREPRAPARSWTGELPTLEAGVGVFKGTTPTTVTLQKSSGKYWGKKSFAVTISKPGYQSQTIPIVATANGWYIAGNIVFGGLIGWFIVDPLNGNMYTLSPDAVGGSLGASSSHNNRARDGSITIVLIDDVPESLRRKMVAVR